MSGVHVRSSLHEILVQVIKDVCQETALSPPDRQQPYLP